MGNKNYTKYSENTENKETVTTPVVEDNKQEEVTTTPEVNTEVQTEPVTEAKIEQKIIPDPVIATVVNCTKLNVRKAADKNSEVVCVIDKGTELTVDVDNSTDNFYKVYTICKDVLVEGYCVKEFISIK